MKRIEALLKQNAQVSAWRVSEKATVSYELFFVHRQLETVRATDTVSSDVTVYVDHDGKKGDSSFSVYASMGEKEIEEKINQAVSRAKLVFNEPYDLPGAGELDAALPTNMAGEDMKELGKKIADAVFAADSVPGGSINACEIFLYRDKTHVVNSNGVDKAQTLHRVMIEAIPTFTEGTESVELYEDYRFTEFNPERVTEEIARRMAEVKDRFTAKKPKTPMTVNVILRPHEIRELMGELAYDLNYASVYSHANLHKIGDDLQKDGAGDPLTLWKAAQVPGSERSACFDEDGAELKDTCLIRDGKVESYYGPSRFGQYLGIKAPSGSLPCTKLEKGTMAQADMRKEPYLECASLSGLQLDLYNDYIGGEIRLAYYFDGEKTVPVTGISMSGRLSAVLANLRLCDETAVDGPYQGPKYLLMPEISVL